MHAAPAAAACYREDGKVTQTQLIIVIIIAVVVIAVVATLVALRLRKKRRIAAMGPEERELYDAERYYRVSVEKARKTLQATQQSWEQRVKDAEDSVKEARRIGYRPLGSLEKVDLFEDHLETPDGAFQLSGGPVSAIVETAEQLATTRQDVLSRAGKEVMRELMAQAGGEGSATHYLLIETPIFVTVRRLRDGDVVKARQFASSINNAAVSTDELARRREEAAAAAQAQLEQVKADMETAVQAANQELERVKANTGRLDAAREAYERIKGAAPAATNSMASMAPPTEDGPQPNEKGAL
ncbi:MAG: hypothetical protein GX536_08845 [Actinobacteria bacterium]|nr:hypothetical protein [Actinomycetota bacterium]